MWQPLGSGIGAEFPPGWQRLGRTTCRGSLAAGGARSWSLPSPKHFPGSDCPCSLWEEQRQIPAPLGTRGSWEDSGGASQHLLFLLGLGRRGWSRPWMCQAGIVSGPVPQGGRESSRFLALPPLPSSKPGASMDLLDFVWLRVTLSCSPCPSRSLILQGKGMEVGSGSTHRSCCFPKKLLSREPRWGWGWREVQDPQPHPGGSRTLGLIQGRSGTLSLIQGCSKTFGLTQGDPGPSASPGPDPVQDQEPHPAAPPCDAFGVPSHRAGTVEPLPSRSWELCPVPGALGCFGAAASLVPGVETLYFLPKTLIFAAI
ncbi:uncharacterized protein LOC116798668 isoform X1 [Chiroxiphia lanceolata]|uniref:uncharacterized protein LOC116798668 isoform X1 n=1 Tax=Chiroxiphia lanceolata TaxID=296741 RepID=UPI0013CE4554|nr:uncharacterized protein LOC116798668 isoform X1 [Chiroxiphia lanceolata]